MKVFRLFARKRVKVGVRKRAGRTIQVKAALPRIEAAIKEKKSD